MPNRAGPPPVQSRALTVVEARLDEVVKGIEKRNDQFLDLLGKENVGRWKAVALHALAGNKKVLQDCTVLSIIEAIRESAALGLSPTGLLGEGWILPYGEQAKFMPGYRGYLKLLRNSGQIRIADAQIVYMNDEFRVELGTDPKIHHVPILYGEKEGDQLIADRGDYRGAYAWVQLNSGLNVVEWMSFDDLMKIRARSPSVIAGRQSPWDTDPGEMMRKTPIRRLVKRLPLESMPHVARAAILDEEGDVIEGTATEVKEPAAQSRATAAAYALGRGQADEESDAQGTAETAEDQAAQDVAGADTEPSVVVGQCAADSPYGDGQVCILVKDHGNNHKGADGSTWA